MKYAAVALLVSVTSAGQNLEWFPASQYSPKYYREQDEIRDSLANYVYCAGCIRAGLTWCQKRTDFEFTDVNGDAFDYTVGPFGVVWDDIVDDYLGEIYNYYGEDLIAICCDDDTCPDVGFWGEDAGGGDGVTPPKSDFICWGEREGTDSHVAMAMCPSLQSGCEFGDAGNSYTFKLGDAEEEIEDGGYLVDYSDDWPELGCTYQVTALSGAPGFGY